MKLRSEGVTWQEIDGELVILDLKTSAYLTTNAAGTTLAKLLTEERSLDELADALVDAFDIDRPQALADADAFVEQLSAKSLLAPID
ncbi:PqqD family protein [Microbacterium ulmi]|uniref:PqqD family protein n=2 Tax=Microbacterium ulmi TaxID=179095 RepID=A0A7Y2LYU3_9MICO|nr:PqqD family protein [Microbacterium ulmi]NNH03275.1 PqqD family protein [Microbacterium ulmi]